MTNTLALFIGGFVVAGILADAVLNGGQNLLFLSRKFVDLSEWLAFWR
jgi:hypothetical protein